MWFREGLNAKTNICVKIQKHIKLRKYLSFFQAGVVMSVCVYMNSEGLGLLEVKCLQEVNYIHGLNGGEGFSLLEVNYVI